MSGIAKNNKIGESVKNVKNAKKILKLPIGIQDFEKLRQGGYLYVDKTKYLIDLIDNGTVYFLSRKGALESPSLSRPTMRSFLARWNYSRGCMPRNFSTGTV